MDFTKNIPDSLVCNWFYAFFVVNAVIASIAIVGLLYSAFSKGALRALFTVQSLTMLISGAIAATNMLFFYIICDRSLKPSAQVKAAAY
jgi:hypothetical protein